MCATPRIYKLLFAGLGLLAMACAGSYYQKHYDFNSEFESGDLSGALRALQKKESLANGRSKFLYFVNNGLVLSILGRYEESNDYFEKAFLFGEDYQINYLQEAATYFTNPTLSVYRGEDHEHLMLLYFKAINYLKLNNPEAALVECRRLNIRLQQLSDKYTSGQHYRRDAFVHNLMGIIYQSTGDYNHAFIAYRNALEIYENDYSEMFSVPVPEQLKKDLLTTAWATGFYDSFDFYRDKFQMDDFEPERPEAELVFFWHNGLAPVKSEWSVNFVIDHLTENAVVFSNTNLGISFPFPIDQKRDYSDLRRLSVFRVAFPRYVERPEYYTFAAVETDDMTVALERSQDVNAIAFHSLRSRMMLEFSKGLLRAALKKAAELSLRERDEGLASLIGIVNALTEKADTRNWQTLPHSIWYARVPLREGENQVAFRLGASDDEARYSFAYHARHGQTLFHTFSSLETRGEPFFYGLY